MTAGERYAYTAPSRAISNHAIMLNRAGGRSPSLLRPQPTQSSPPPHHWYESD
jgi:hypothetical protein